MKHCVNDQSTGAPPAPARPHLSITVARFIVRKLGIGGHAFVRSDYLQTFYQAATLERMNVSMKQCFRNRMWMHRMTRTK